MLSNILLAVDGSDAALGAARAAAALAAATGGSIRVLTVHHEPADSLGEPLYSASLDRSLDEAEEHLSAAVAAIRAAGGPEPTTDRLVGHPAEAILSAAAAGRHDVIVLGNRGRGRVAAALLGSVSTAVASRAKIPVLIIPHEAG